MNPSTTPHDAPADRPGGVLSLAYGLVSYLLFGASFCVYWIAFLADRWVPITVNRRPGDALPLWAAVAVDLGLVLLFGLQHSVMARPGFKRWWTRIVPAGLERSTYVLLASLFLALLMVAWQPLPEVVWQVDSAAGQALLWGLFALGLPICVLASFQIDHFDLLGLRQAWAHFRGRPYTPPEFVQPWLYRVVRHPIQLGVLLMLWPLPTMTAGHLLLATSMTGYMLIGLWFEERDLVAAFGERYREYRRRVPGLVPGLSLVTRLLPSRTEPRSREKAGRTLGAIGALALALPGLATATTPAPVSPGSAETVTSVASRCPTFSWTHAAGASSIELAVYRLDPSEGSTHPAEAPPVLEQRLPAGAGSWTPDSPRCLDPGGRYAWFVRAEEGEELAPWSEGNLFAVDAPLGAADGSASEDRTPPFGTVARSEDSDERGPEETESLIAPTQSAVTSAPEPRIAAQAESVSFRTSGGIMTGGGYYFATPRSSRVLVPASSFRLRSNFEDTEWVLQDGYGYVRSMPAGNGRVHLVAPIDLPPGSTVERVLCRVFDNVELDPDTVNDIDDLTLHMTLVRRYRAILSPEPMAIVSIATEGELFGLEVKATDDIGHRTIDPAAFEYLLEGTYRAESQGSSLRFYGCEIQLEVDRLGPA